MGTKITASSSKSSSSQSGPMCHTVFSTDRACTSSPPAATASAEITMPITARFFRWLNKKLSAAKKNEAMTTLSSSVFITSPVYTSRNSGVVKYSGK